MSPAAGAATLTARRSTRFVAWVRAWRAGLVPYDDIADEIAGDEEHLVADAPGTWTDVPLGSALSSLSRLHPDEIRLVLPAAGDPRGLPGPGPFTSAALLAGEGVIAGDLGVIPEVRIHTSGSGDTFETVLWRVYTLVPPEPGRGHPELDPPASGPGAHTADPGTPASGPGTCAASPGAQPAGQGGGPPDTTHGAGPHPAGQGAGPHPTGPRRGGHAGHETRRRLARGFGEPGTAEAEAELSAALAEATARLTRLDVAQWRPELAGALAALRRPSSGTDLPPGFDPRARRLYARASVLDQVLALAETAAPGGAINGYEAQQRDAALRPLTTACRRALVAACNAPLSPA